MAFNLKHNVKRNLLIGATILALATNIPVVGPALTSVTGFSLTSGITVVAVASLIGLYTMWLVVNREL